MDVADEPPSWYWPSFDAVLGQADGLLEAAGPRELEQTTGELLGEQLSRAVSEGQVGLHFDRWFQELTAAAGERVDARV